MTDPEETHACAKVPDEHVCCDCNKDEYESDKSWIMWPALVIITITVLSTLPDIIEAIKK